MAQASMQLLVWSKQNGRLEHIGDTRSALSGQFKASRKRSTL